MGRHAGLRRLAMTSKHQAVVLTSTFTSGVATATLP